MQHQSRTVARPGRRALLSAGLAGVATAAVIGLGSGLPALAYPPPPPAHPAPQGTFPTVVATKTLGTAAETVIANVPGPGGVADVAITIPAGALPPGTVVQIAAPDTSTLGAYLPQDAVGKMDSAFAITWHDAQGKKPTASEPITISVKDPDVHAGDAVYEVTTGGLVAWPAASTSDGTVTVTFTGDPGFVVLPASVKVTALGAGAKSSSGLPFTGQYLAPMTGAGLGLVVAGGLMTVAVRRRRRPAVIDLSS